VEKALPSSVQTEVTVLGASLLSSDCFNDALELLSAEDFSLDSHAKIFTSISELAETGNPVDLITVMEDLMRRKSLDAVGGAAYLAFLTEGIPRNPNIAAYCRIVKDKSVLRSLMVLCDSSSARAQDQSESPSEILGSIEERILELSQAQNMKSFTTLLDALEAEGGPDNFIAKMCDPAKMTGLATGFSDLDKMLGGLQKKELIIIAARPSMGKAQPLDAKILTPTGFTTMGNVKVGSTVMGSDGKGHKVTGVFPQGMMTVFRVTFTDGTSTECSDDHLWFTQTRNERRRGCMGSVKTLNNIRKTIKRPDGGNNNHAIPLPAPIEYEPIDDPLLIRPYTLGVLLGDGCLAKGKNGGSAVISNPEPDIFQRVQSELPITDKMTFGGDQISIHISRMHRDGTASGTMEALRFYGLAGKQSYGKFIPDVYMRSSVEDRRMLLAGLLDTDGHVNACGRSIEYSTSSPQLAEQVVDLVRGLGMRASVSSRMPTYIYKGQRLTGKQSFRVRIFSGNKNPTLSEKNAHRWEKSDARATHKAVVSVERIGRKICQCIRVDARDSLYITDDFIVTHNTALAINIAQNIALHGEQVAAIFSLEMSKESLWKRIISSMAEVSSRRAQAGFISGEERRRMLSALLMIAEKQLHIDDTASLTTMQMRARCRRLKQQIGRLDLIVVDYLQLMRGVGKYGNREQEVSSISRGLKALAKELDAPVVALSQLSRKSEERGDKRPMLSDLRESGSLEQDADVVAFIHREDYYDRDNEDIKGIAEIIIAKQRNGPTGSVKMAYQDVYTRFSNLEIQRSANAY